MLNPLPLHKHTDTSEWSSPCTSGAPPTPRQGHISVVVENKLLVHGGMAGQDILSDLHILDLGMDQVALKFNGVLDCAAA